MRFAIRPLRTAPPAPDRQGEQRNRHQAYGAQNERPRSSPPGKREPRCETSSNAGNAPDLCVPSISAGGCVASDDALSGCDMRACSASNASFCRKAMCCSVKVAGRVEKTSRIPLIPRLPRIGKTAIDRKPRLRQTSRSTSGSFSVSAQCWILPVRRHSPEIPVLALQLRPRLRAQCRRYARGTSSRPLSTSPVRLRKPPSIAARHL